MNIKISKKIGLFLNIILIFASFTLAQEQTMPEILVEGDLIETMLKTGQIKNSIIKTQSISNKKIEEKQAMTLSEAIKNEPGIDSVVGCSICGMRRVQINGLKGEHTTVLIDGVPLNSTVSGYYGFSALTMAGVSEIEIARGAGSAMSAPEAIGGVINIVMKNPERTGVFLNTSYADHEKMISAMATGVSLDKKRKVIIASQYSKELSYDSDNNGVNESPNIRDHSTLFKYSYDLGNFDNLELRLAGFNSFTYGGSLNRYVFQTVNTTGSGLVFQDNDVRKAYLGDPKDITEIIDTEREEGILKWTHKYNEKINTIITLAGASQKQDSYYEGADYANKDNTIYAELKNNFKLSDLNFITLGLNFKNEKLRSRSFTYFDNLGRSKDDFNYSQNGFYAQDIFTPNEKIELSLATRLDQIKLNFTDQKDKRNEVDKTIVSPRVHLKLNHSEKLSSRFAYGLGFRAPLTFFESEHGLLDNGFQTKISNVEKSNSFSYTLSYNSERLTGNTSFSWTKLKNMAYVNDVDFLIPTLVNYNGDVNVKSFDIILGYQLSKLFSIGTSYEKFDYQNKYKELLGFAAVEDRIKLLFGLDDEEKGLNIDIESVWIGSRDLASYGYTDRYNIYDGITAYSPKRTQSPSFITTDIKISKKIKEDLTLYAGGKNIFDYTQSYIESPLFYDSTGGFDVAQIWGPLKGREIYFGATMKF